MGTAMAACVLIWLKAIMIVAVVVDLIVDALLLLLLFSRRRSAAKDVILELNLIFPLGLHCIVVQLLVRSFLLLCTCQLRLELPLGEEILGRFLLSARQAVMLVDTFVLSRGPVQLQKPELAHGVVNAAQIERALCELIAMPVVKRAPDTNKRLPALALLAELFIS